MGNLRPLKVFKTSGMTDQQKKKWFLKRRLLWNTLWKSGLIDSTNTKSNGFINTLTKKVYKVSLVLLLQERWYRRWIGNSRRCSKLNVFLSNLLGYMYTGVGVDHSFGASTSNFAFAISKFSSLSKLKTPIINDKTLLHKWICASKIKILSWRKRQKS